MQKNTNGHEVDYMSNKTNAPGQSKASLRSVLPASDLLR